MSEIFLYVAGGLAVMSLVLVAGAALAFRRRRWIGSLGSAGTGALLLSLAALAATLGISTQGYRALTLEEVAATITTVPSGPGAFEAHVQFPDGREDTFLVAGEQLLVDAHILKWHPLANIVGFHTQYELDRLSGRYVEIEDERTEPRTVHSLKAEKPADLFHLARRYTLLALLVDTEYGSATFIQVDRPARFEIRVSTTGLLIREAGYP
ncbi:membrane protein [soil metagenome]